MCGSSGEVLYGAAAADIGTREDVPVVRVLNVALYF